MFQATPLTERNLRREGQVKSLFLLATVLLILPVAAVLGILIWRGGPAHLDRFLLTEPRDGMTAGGIFPALVGTIWLVAVALVASVPIGVAAALYLSEYARDNWLTRLINLAIINLAGVPSIVHALFGVGAFVLFFRFGTGILAASLTLAVMSLPVVIVATREALQAVPRAFREACWALGATRWQTIRRVVLPNSTQRHPHRGHPRGVAHRRRDRADHVHRRRVLPALPAAERLRPDHGAVASRLRDRDPGAGRAGVAALRRGAGADRPGAADERALDRVPGLRAEAQEVVSPAVARRGGARLASAQARGARAHDPLRTKRVLRDVDLDIDEHEIFGIIGPAGSGKTSFLRAINRMDEMTPGMRVDGEVLFDGRPVKSWRNVYALRARIGVVFPLPVGLPLSIYDNVALAPRLAGVRAQGRARRPSSSAACAAPRCGTRSRTAWDRWEACSPAGSSSG